MRFSANTRAYVGPQRRPGHGVAATKERVLAGSRRGGIIRRYCSRPARVLFVIENVIISII